MTNNKISPENKYIFDAGLALVWYLIIIGIIGWTFLLCVRVLPEVRNSVNNSRSENVENKENTKVEKPTNPHLV